MKDSHSGISVLLSVIKPFNAPLVIDSNGYFYQSLSVPLQPPMVDS